MILIDIKPDCGNAPRKAFLRDFNIAFAKGDVDFIMEHLSDDVTWEIPGEKTVGGKENMRAALSGMKDRAVEQLTLDKIITHGTDAAASGRFRLPGEEFAFCDVYQFIGHKGTTLKSFSSYVIKLK